ncbi:MAG TPA: condensation domain-containing protein, partial [Pyrinomonadaceae bacterium]|nr:condensation domain-containing protein [Pyrinomonadaceae bacterium]
MMRNVEDIYQLSPAQEARLAATLADETSVRLGQMSCVLAGPLDLASFEWAWQQVLNRHTILRTSFVWKRLDKPLQVVNRQLSATIQTHEWQSLSAEQQQENLAALRSDELSKEIDLSIAPLARVVLCRTGADSAHLILTYHPLILDERSVALLLHEVLAYYASAGNGRSPQLAASNPFWSYVSWVKEQDLARAESFWSESLRDFKDQTPLEAVYSRGDLVDARAGYDQVVTEIPSESLATIEALADRTQVTFETLMHGAWALLLNRETGDEDVVYGFAEAPRNLDGNMLGPVSTILPVRVRIDTFTPAIAWIKSLQNQLNNIRRHSFFTLNERPALQTVVSDHLGDDIEVHSSSVKVLNVDTRGPVNVPIVVNLPQPTAPQLRVRFDRTLFSRETIEKISAHFVTLLTGLVSNTDQPVLDLPFLTTAELKQLSAWNQTATDYPRDGCVHQLFEQQAEARPEEIAVVFEDEQLTYAQLNERANQLARHLRLLGVQPETRIALCVERSLEMMVGILGILKAGAAFAPIDPSHPLERLSFMLEDLQAPVVLTQQHLLDKLPAHWGQVISLDSDRETIALQSTENPINEATAENLAYVMYTSGSTGTPKGVQIEHRSIVRLVGDVDYVRLDRDTCFLHAAPLGFD